METSQDTASVGSGSKPIETLSSAELRFDRWRRTIGLFAGPATFLTLEALLCAAAPSPATHLAAVLGWVMVWWVTEAVPLPVTALLGPTLGVMLGVGTAVEMFAPFGDPVIFLFLGSFVIAQAMSTSGLDRRFALAVLSCPWVGVAPWRLLAMFAVASGGLSMWLSNTATTAMLCPVALSVLGALHARTNSPGHAAGIRAMGTALVLTIAYGASIGGVGTPVGTPPNLIVLAQLERLAQVRIPFFAWMLVCGPLLLLMLAAMVGYFRWRLPRTVAVAGLDPEQLPRLRASLGPWTPAQRNTLLAFGLTVGLWIAPGLLAVLDWPPAGVGRNLQLRLPEGMVALLGAILLFVLPVDWSQRRFTVGWQEAKNIDWGTLLLFGGGLSLGAAMVRTGLATTLGSHLVGTTGADSLVELTLLFAIAALVLTEVTSNTAAATIVAPLAIAAAQSAQVNPVAPAMAVAVVASMAFLLPISTPPNAIAYSSGMVPITTMVRRGAMLDLLSVVLAPVMILLMVSWLGL